MAALRVSIAGFLALASCVWADTIVLQSGEMLEGKARQWGDIVYFWDRFGEQTIYHRDELRDVRYKRRPDQLVKPDLPDLTVRYIERLPRDPGFHGVVDYNQPGKKDLPVLMVDPAKYQLHRQVDEVVTFVIHVFNAGAAAAGPFDYTVSIDDQPFESGRIDGLKPAEEKLVEVEWNWEDDPHEIKVELDPQKTIKEITRLNNTFVDPTRALTFFFAVHQTTYDNFSKSLNVVDSFCFEDWAQYHVHMMNYLFAESKWPSAPNGIAERVRVDKIIVVPETDEKLYEKHRRRNGDPKEIIEYNGNWSFGKSDPIEQTQRWALSVDWGLPHELAHQLGLVDIYQLNVDPWQINVRRGDGCCYNYKHFYPEPKTMMHWHGPHLFSEQCANYLNQTLGRPRGYFGDYYYDVPDKCILQVLSNSGKPVSGAKLELYQRHAFEEPFGHIGPEPIATGQTDQQGQFVMPNRPAPHHKVWAEPGMHAYEMRDNPWGHIHVVGANATMLARVTAADCEEFYFLRLFDFNVAKWRGHDKQYVHVLKSHLPDPGAPEPPQNLRVEFHMPPDRERVNLRWDRSPSADAVQYNVYKKVGDGDDIIEPFRLVAQVERDRLPKEGPIGWGDLKLFDFFDDHGLYSPDTSFAAAAVTAEGRESALSVPVHVPRLHEARKAAVLLDGRVVFSANRGSSLWFSPGNGGLADLPIRCPDYNIDPEGVCVTPDGNLIVTDGHSNQVVFFDVKGTFLRKLTAQPPDRNSRSSKPGEFDRPCDAAADADGNLYVVDRDNHRVQVFGKDGKLRYAFGEKGKGEKAFERPGAVSVCGKSLLVSDEGNRRVVIYRIEADGVKFEREITGLGWPDRALLAESGNVYVCDVGDNTLKVFDREGKPIRKLEALESAFEPGSYKLDGPRGLCTRDGRTAYLVTRFPVRTLKVRLD